MSTLAAAADSMHGKLHGADHTFNGVSIDTRTLRQGELFIALQGPNFDGCDYVGQARDKGAAGAVVPRFVDTDLAQIAVGDSRRALGELGAAWRKQLSPVVVGVTGSNGKTTLKELTAACLATAAPTLATHGNLNNDIGMPLMLTRIEDRHRYAVLEMGANHAGEIAYLTALAKPDIVVITNAGEAHLEGFGSRDGVARGKGEILCGETRPKVAILNADDPYFDYWSKLVEDTRLITFGIDADADVYARNIVGEAEGSSFDLYLPALRVAQCPECVRGSRDRHCGRPGHSEYQDGAGIRNARRRPAPARRGNQRRDDLRRQLQRQSVECRRRRGVSRVIARRQYSRARRHGRTRRRRRADAHGDRCAGSRGRYLAAAGDGRPVPEHG